MCDVGKKGGVHFAGKCVGSVKGGEIPASHLLVAVGGEAAGVGRHAVGGWWQVCRGYTGLWNVVELHRDGEEG